MAESTKLQDKGAWRETGSIGESPYVPGSAEEKRLVRKIDLRIVPIIWLLYTVSYLDRGNIGNAKTAGMQADLKFTSNQYSVILLLFFVSYVLCEVPANMFLSRTRPSIYMPVLCFTWGAIAALMAACTTWQAVAGVRFVLGVVEAGFAPGVTFYLSSWYKPHELARRYSIYYTATAVSGAVSGLLAALITQHLNGKHGIAGWKYLFIIEGVASCGVACFAWMIMPDWPSTTKWLTDAEKVLAVQRLRYNNLGEAGEVDNISHGAAFKMAWADWRTWCFAPLYMLATGAMTIQYFIPTIVGQLGYKGYKAQYMTMPIYGVALVFILFFNWVSDFRKERANWITVVSIIAAIGFIITVAVDNKKVKYAFLCFGVGGIYAGSPLTMMYTSNSIPFPAEKRAIVIATVNGLGNSASIYGVFLWPATTAPRYTQGFATTTAFAVLAAVGVQVYKYYALQHPYPLRDDLDKQGGQVERSIAV